MFSNLLVVHILEYLNQNIYCRIHMKELEDTFHYNKDYIMRVFKREIHTTIIEYINTKRIFSSLQSLSKNSSILSIALSYGFTSQEYYCEMFHHIIGVSPSDYRQFLNYSIGLPEEKIFIIQDSLAEISFFLQNVEKYCQNIPPEKAVKVLSIFK